MKSKTSDDPESLVRDIKRKTRRKFSVDEKKLIILEDLKDETSSAELFRLERIVETFFFISCKSEPRDIHSSDTVSSNTASSNTASSNTVSSNTVS